MVLALALQLSLAHAAGFTGYSGKQGMICNQCHAGGAAPTVTLTGPNQLMVGMSATYTVTITGGAASRGGFNAAASTGVTFTAGTNSRTANGEITHTAPQTFTAGSLAFSFTVQVPNAAGTVKLYAAGNSVNFNTTNQGDQAAATTLDITVIDPNAPKPDAGSGTGGTDAGTGGPIIGLGDGGNTTVAPLDTDAGTGPVTMGPASTGPHVAGALSGGVVDGGCSAAGGLAPFAIAALILMRRRRAR